MHAVDLFITPSGNNLAGENYSLECSASITDQLTLSWLDSEDMEVSSGMVTSTGSVSTLTFNPLIATHAGTYTCRALLGSFTQNVFITVTVAGKHFPVILCI